MKKVLYSVITLLLISFPVLVKANEKYDIYNYDIEIKVAEDYNYTYIENVDVSFKEKYVEFQKEVPKNIQNLKVNAKYVLLSKYNKVIEINSGEQIRKTYTIQYQNQLTEEKDNKYIVNIFNTYQSDLNNVSFLVDFPDYFNKANITFYINNQKVDDINFEIDKTKLKGTISKLSEGDVLRIELDYSKIYVNGLIITSIVMPIILSLISLGLWYLYGRDLKYTITKTENISNKYTPLDVSLIQNGQISVDDVFYLMISLANKGYIKIIENAKNNYTIKKLKDYDGKNYKEASFFKNLFRKDKSISLSEYINVISEKTPTKKTYELDNSIPNDLLIHRFDRASRNVLSIMDDKDEKNIYFEAKSEEKKSFLVIAIAIILVFITSIPFIEINKLVLLPISVLFSIITLYNLLMFVNNIDIKNKRNKILILVVLGLLTLMILLIPSFRRNKIYLLAYLISCICVSFILFLYKYMPKRTIYGTKEFGKIEGFKEFTANITKEDITSIISTNKNYLYDILPYSFVLGTDGEVIKKMKDCDTSSPSWLILKEQFTVQKMYNSLNRLKKYLKNDEEEE